MTTTLQIKHMVCPRCIQSVVQLLEQLEIAQTEVSLGQVKLPQPLTPPQQTALEAGLKKLGFELLEDREQQLVNQIKSLLIDWVHYQPSSSSLNLSERLSQALHRDYSSLSKTFSQRQGTTIEQYWMQQRLERAKELLSYGEQAVGQIALDLGYSSTAHFSNQFKKYMGCSPTAYQKHPQQDRRFLDAID